jgi:arginyl-tRNA synthetase
VDGGGRGAQLDLAAAFSTFWERCPVAPAEAEVRAGRKALAELTGRTLHTGMSLLGIEAPERI